MGRLEAEYANLRDTLGKKDEKTLTVCFQLLDCLIGLYRLKRMDEILVSEDDMRNACREVGGQWHIKGTQSLAFCRWKQYQFREALALFHEIAGLTGPDAALFENMAHTYNTLGDF